MGINLLRTMCGMSAACPSVFETDYGTLLIVGHIPSEEALKSVSHKVGKDESVVEIPKELLERYGPEL